MEKRWQKEEEKMSVCQKKKRKKEGKRKRMREIKTAGHFLDTKV